jgi:hypothetical protein
MSQIEKIAGLIRKWAQARKGTNSVHRERR